MSEGYQNSSRQDQCRDAILRHLHAHMKQARGMRTSGRKFTDIRGELKTLGYKQQEVVEALSYLRDKGWVSVETRSRQYRTKLGTLRDAETTTYRISDAGTDRLEGGSVFQHNPVRFQGINITNVGGVAVVGNGNIVNSQLGGLANSLEELIGAVERTKLLTDEQKLDASADLTSIRAQLSKPNPSKAAVSALWAGLGHLATVSDLVQLVQLVAQGLQLAGLV